MNFMARRLDPRLEVLRLDHLIGRQVQPGDEPADVIQRF